MMTLNREGAEAKIDEYLDEAWGNLFFAPDVAGRLVVKQELSDNLKAWLSACIKTSYEDGLVDNVKAQLDKQVICKNCDEKLEDCDKHGCGATREKGWRVKMIADMMSKMPGTQDAHQRALDAVLKFANRDPMMEGKK